MSMTHGTKPSEDANARPASSHGSTSSSGSSKHVKCIGRYVMTGALGKGNFARVESAVHTLTRAKVAIKIIETDKIKEEYVRKNLLREAQLMRRLRHPNIIRLYETMKTNNLYCLVTEIAEGGELLSHVRSDYKEKRLSEATTRPYIRQLVSALYHLHSVGIVHRDLKMENILLDKRKRNIKIVDFGLSNAAKPGSLLQTHCGSPEYAAPELFIPGREYGPEVDVWSLGVNMYAMLVGKLPFRSPRQGTKRRQKLLEQITGGLTDSHEKEMGHISKGAKDLIHLLLQPDPKNRIGLDQVMLHSWATKDGTQPLHPFKYIPPDPATQIQVIEMMSTILEVRAGEIKETVRRDRCDWLAAIYNLLLDQPEGRNVLVSLIMNDPEEQLVDAAHYQGSMEHFRLSQGDNLDEYSPEVASVLTNATAQIKRTAGYRYSLSQPQAQSENGDYISSTLPLTKKEKRRHSSSHEQHPLGARRNLGPIHPPPHMLRRASIASPVMSPSHQPHYDPQQQQLLQQQSLLLQQQQQHQLHQQLPIEQQHHHHQHHQHRQGSGHHSHKKGRRILPMTPNEEPYQHPHGSDVMHPHGSDVMRPHSRAESTPDPLPTPWRPNLAHRNQLVSLQQSPTQSSVSQPRSPGEDTRGHPGYREQPPPSLMAPMTAHKSSSKKLSPLRPKSVNLGSKDVVLSKSIDGLNLRPPVTPQPGSHTVSGIQWKKRQPMLQLEKKGKSMEGGALRGWSSSQRLGQAADIQGLMLSGMPSSSYNAIPHDKHKLDTSSINRDYGSATSIEISHDLFAPSPRSPSSNTSPVASKGPSPQGPSPQGPSPQGPSPQASNSHFRPSSESTRYDPLGEVLSQKHRRHHTLNHKSHRSSSAKPSKKSGMHHMPAELTNSLGHVGMEQKNGYHHNHEELPSLEEPLLNGHHHGEGGGGGGFLGKGFKKNSTKDKNVHHSVPKYV